VLAAMCAVRVRAAEVRRARCRGAKVPGAGADTGGCGLPGRTATIKDTVTRTLRILTVVLAALAVPAVARAQDPIHWSISRTPTTNVDPGKQFDVALTAQIDLGWHLYSLDQQQGAAGGPIATTILLPAKQVFSLVGGIVSPPAKRALDPNFNVETEFFEESATFGATVKVAAGTKPGRYTLRFEANYITCSDRICLPPKTDAIELVVGVGKDAPPAGPAGAATAGVPTGSGVSAGSTVPKGSGVPKGSEVPAGSEVPKGSGVPAGSAAPAGSAGPAEAAGSPAAAAVAVRVPDLAASSQASTLGAYVGLAAIMGALSLLTPCVFPMVPITISYFTNRAGKSRREATIQALIYGLGIVLTFTAVGFTLAVAFGASGLNRFASDPWLNLGITALFLAFAMSLFGVWELALPSKLVTAASKADSGKGRFVGTLLMGLAFTLTSFTCTAPFLGTLLVVASQGDWQWPLAGMLAFSGVFALPFVILALLPQTLASLPRSGPWLIAVKAVMGLVEIAAAMKFLSNADLVWNWGIFTRPVVLATWVVLAVVLVAYLAGLTKLGPVPKLRRPGFGRWSAVAAGVLVGVWLAGGLMGRRLGELEAFLPPADLAHMSGSELAWVVNDYDAGLATAKKNGQPMLIDFTGYTCTNCRWMEANMFTKPEVERELARYVRVRLYTDRPGEPYEGYQKMERDLFGTVALPYYAVFSPDGKPVVAFGGLTRDPAEYINFLRRGLQ